MPNFHKNHRFRCKAYLEWIARHVCCNPVCGHPETEAHHVETRGAGGSDLTCVPLCRACHSELHAAGIKHFQEKYQFSLMEAQWEFLQSFIQDLFKELDKMDVEPRR